MMVVLVRNRVVLLILVGHDGIYIVVSVVKGQ